MGGGRVMVQFRGTEGLFSRVAIRLWGSKMLLQLLWPPTLPPAAAAEAAAVVAVALEEEEEAVEEASALEDEEEEALVLASPATGEVALCKASSSWPLTSPT